LGAAGSQDPRGAERYCQRLYRPCRRPASAAISPLPRFRFWSDSGTTVVIAQHFHPKAVLL